MHAIRQGSPARLSAAALAAFLCFSAAGLPARGAQSAAAPSISAAPETAPDTRVLSREHVNLVRIRGEKITDVVFDAQALEVSADKARGIVFVRVKKAWLASGQGDVTSAFFNTEKDNHAVRFVVSSVPAQTIELAGSGSGVTDAISRERDKALEAPLAPLKASDYVDELKRITLLAAVPGKAAERAPLGMAYREEADKTEPLVLPQAPVAWAGLKVRTTQAFVTRDKVCEAMILTNLTPRATRIDLARLAEAAKGVLAFAIEKTNLAPGEATEVIVIRRRAEAVLETATGLRLTAEHLVDDEEKSVK